MLLEASFYLEFLCNYKDPDFENIVGNMLAILKALGCSMSLKLHFSTLI